ncbi:MAG: hypothetical protein ACOYUZ_04785 [Patescibacteria group bacterium]
MKSTTELIDDFERDLQSDCLMVIVCVARSKAALQMQEFGQEVLPAIVVHLQARKHLDHRQQLGWSILLRNIAEAVKSSKIPQRNALYDEWLAWAKGEVK